MFYAVRVGRVPGVYETWSECQEQVSGFSGAEFMKFKTYEEAYDYFRGNEFSEEGIYIDGSFIEGNFACAVLVYNGEESFYKVRQVPDDYRKSGSVGAELYGALLASQIRQEMGLNLPIYYDNKGIKFFLDGTWKARTDIAKQYIQDMKDYPDVFEKVKAHSCVTFNKLADKLAKQGAKFGRDMEGKFDEYGRTF